MARLSHVGFAILRPTIYRRFADESSWSWVRDGWHNVFMAEPRLWALLLAAGELLIAVLLSMLREERDKGAALAGGATPRPAR